jgi:hypothetical protein
MRQVTTLVIFVVIVAAVAGWLAATTTSADTVRAADDFLGRYSIGGPTLPIVF